MNRLPRYALAAAILLLLLFSCRRGRKMISPSDMSKIYADMLVMDQWLRINAEGRKADTTLVYEPIFNKYGYTLDDYIYSMNAYEEEPEALSKIYDRTEAMLQAHIDSVNEDRRLRNQEDSLRRVRMNYKFNRFAPIQLPGNTFRADTIHFEMDTTVNAWRLGDAQSDTTFDGPRMVLRERDTTAVGLDSLAAPVEDISPEAPAPSPSSREGLRTSPRGSARDLPRSVDMVEDDSSTPSAAVDTKRGKAKAKAKELPKKKS